MMFPAARAARTAMLTAGLGMADPGWLTKNGANGLRRPILADRANFPAIAENPPMPDPVLPGAQPPRSRFTLVRTSHPGNIGAAARAIRTMGFQRLSLVAPQRFPHADAVAMASGALAVLDKAVVTPTL